jgi:enterochelin esterase family protein
MGRTNVILDNLTADKKIKPFIVVMETSAVGTPAAMFGTRAGAGQGGPGPGAKQSPGAKGRAGSGGFSGFGADYGQLMIEDLIPYIDANFRTLTDQQNRAMAGLSMGGMITRTVTLAHLDIFSHIGIFSGGTISMSDVESTKGFKEKVKVVFMSYGSRERGADSVKAAAESLQGAGIKSAAYISPNTAHEWQSWRRSLYHFAQLLFQE